MEKIDKVLDKASRIITYLYTRPFYKPISFDEIARHTGIESDEVFDFIRLIRMCREYTHRIDLTIGGVKVIGYSHAAKNIPIPDIIMIALFSMLPEEPVKINDILDEIRKKYDIIIDPDIEVNTLFKTQKLDTYISIKNDNISLTLRGKFYTQRLLLDIMEKMLETYEFVLQELDKNKCTYITVLENERMIITDAETHSETIQKIADKYGYGVAPAKLITEDEDGKTYYVPDINGILTIEPNEEDGRKFTVTSVENAVRLYQKYNRKNELETLESMIRNNT